MAKPSAKFFPNSHKPMIQTDKIAVVILNWNGRDMMRRFLPSVVRHSADLGLVVVADNGSTDGSLEMLEAEFPEVERLPLPQNYGFAAGYNEALRQIDAPYYLLLNSDVEVTEGWLRPLRDYMEAHPEAAACQPKLLWQRQKDTFEYAGGAGGYLDRLGYPFCRGRVFGTLEKDHGQYDTVAPLLWATGAALLVRRTDWEEAGGLDSRFFAHMEEIDFCWRLRCRGRQIVCVPGSVAYHVGGATLDAGHPRKTFLNFRNNLLMLYKNLPEGELHSVMRWRTLLDGVAALQFLLKGQLDHFKAVVRARREYRRLRPEFEAARRENLARAVDGAQVAERRRFCLLFQYYFKGRKQFSTLPRL